MEKISGIEFEKIGDTLISPDGRISITGIDKPEQGINFGVLDFTPYAEFFDRFTCVTLGVSPLIGDTVLNLDAVLHDERITRFHIDADYGPVPTTFSPDRLYFANLRELHVLGNCPTDFPDLRANIKLKKLTVQYHKPFSTKWDKCASVRDLIVHDYTENDLTALQGMIGIERLTIARGKLSSLKGIENFPNLKTLILAKTPKLVDFESLLNAPSLKNIMIEAYKKRTDWEFLAEKKDWEAIILDTAETAKFAQNLPNLKYFYSYKVKDQANACVTLSREGLDKPIAPDLSETSSVPAYPAFYEHVI